MKKILIFLLLVSTGFAQEPVNFGWSPPSQEQKALSKDNQYTQQLQELVKYNDDSDALIYRFLYKALKDSNQLTQEELDSGRLNSLDQGQYGFCVAYSGALCIDIVSACDIYVRHENERWVTRAHPIAIYGLGRNDNRGNYDGSSGSWQTEAYNKYGTLFRLKYESYDLLSLTDGSVGRQWAARGMPEELLKQAIDHKIIACSLIKTIDEAKAAIQNGYPITICAAASYGNKRNTQGFISLSGKNWNHSMTVTAYRAKTSGNEGFLIQNSWNNDWCGGGIYPEDQPHGSFWVTPKDLLFHLNQDDSYAIAGYNGFKKRNLKWEELFKIGEKINVEDN